MIQVNYQGGLVALCVVLGIVGFIIAVAGAISMDGKNRALYLRLIYIGIPMFMLGVVGLGLFTTGPGH